MNELMIHVEKIVRPVRAFAARKLRMRRELLAHLQAAVVEEGGDEATALERAKSRLGEPRALTEALQETVPWIERVFLARIPLPRSAERWEGRSGKWWRSDCPMTMLQAMALVAGATALPCFVMVWLTSVLHIDREATPKFMFEHPVLWGLSGIGTSAMVVATILVCARLVTAIASDGLWLRGRKAVWYAVGIIGMPVVSMLMVVGTVNHRMATGGELARCFGVGVVLLVSEIGMGWLVGKMRRPYAEWLALEVAG